MTIRFIIVLSLFVQGIFGQTSSFKKNYTNTYKNSIDYKLKHKKLSSKIYPEMSYYGGTLTGYYLDNKLVLIIANRAVEFCYHEYAYYIKNDSLVFVAEQITKVKEPDNFDEYILKHTDKNNNTDLSKLPLELNEFNQYYFYDNKIFDYSMKSFRKKVIITKDEVGQKNKTLLMFFKSHLSELATVK